MSSSVDATGDAEKKQWCFESNVMYLRRRRSRSGRAGAATNEGGRACRDAAATRIDEGDGYKCDFFPLPAVDLESYWS
jgi:hypothetical protein